MDQFGRQNTVMPLGTIPIADQPRSRDWTRQGRVEARIIADSERIASLSQVAEMMERFEPSFTVDEGP